MISDVMTTLRATLSDAERDIRELRTRIGKKEQLLISDKSSAADRRRLLGEIKEHHREIFWLQQDAEDSRFELLRKQSEYDLKSRSYTY
jgi:predicted  nucleic acid-binding Zn-ribbon protein